MSWLTLLTGTATHQGSITQDNPCITGTVCDVSDRRAVENFVEAAVRTLGGMDVLVNNAGISGPTARGSWSWIRREPRRGTGWRGRSRPALVRRPSSRARSRRPG
ncbi:SDR family NAD(P)-dependent oxidoreductase [Streptomyces sp. NPDC000994]